MVAVVQRVSQASVLSEGRVVGEIGAGLVILVGIERDDTEAQAAQLADQIIGLRIFADEHNKMNRSLADTGGSALVVSQFTLAADLSRGRRPSFDGAAPPSQAITLFQRFVDCLREKSILVETGIFRTSMSVHLTNEGPVTFVCKSRR